MILSHERDYLNNHQIVLELHFYLVLANMHVRHARVYQKHHYTINITLERLNH